MPKFDVDVTFTVGADTPEKAWELAQIIATRATHATTEQVEVHLVGEPAEVQTLEY